MLKQLFALLDKEDRKIGYITLFIVTIQAFAEVAGAAAIFPLLIIIIDSDKNSNNFLINQLFKALENFGIFNGNNQNVSLIFLLIFITILILFIRIISAYYKIYFLESFRGSLGRRLLNSYLTQSYNFFTNKNRNDLADNIISEVDQIIKTLAPLVNTIAQFIVGLGLFIFLLTLNLKIGIVLLIFGSLIFLIFDKVFGKYLINIGNIRRLAQKKRVISVNEILSGIKAIKVSNTEHYSLKKFILPNEIFAKMNTYFLILSETPMYFVETFAILGLILFALLSQINNNSSNSESIALIGLYAYTFFKIKPFFTSLIKGTSGFKYGKKTISKMYHDLKLQKKKTYKKSTFQTKNTFKKEVILKNISFEYFKSSQNSLSNINLRIKKGQSIGIVGSTGSGKTTLLNIILGLFKPSSGEILVDGKRLDYSNLSNWQNNIGYVSQEIFMLDATISENIVFGRDTKVDNNKAIRIAAKKAKIDNFIEKKLQKNYDTKIGDRGIRLSGGEKQRIAIARALYKDPDIIILDEATSFLDPLTEKKVIEDIQDLSKQKTIIMIAHRLNTVKNCDLIIVLNEGNIEAYGNYSELKNSENSFSKMLDI